MKKLILLIPVIALFYFVSCKPSVKEALAYNDTIVFYHENIDRKVAYLADTYDNYVPSEMDTTYKLAILAVNEGIAFINKLEPFNGDDTYKKASLELFELYKSVLEIEHTRIINLLKLPEKLYQEPEVKEMEQLKEAAKNKIQAKIDQTATKQEEFAKKYNFTFKENTEE